jgi:hypothetical protein
MKFLFITKENHDIVNYAMISEVQEMEEQEDLSKIKEVKGNYSFSKIIKIKNKILKNKNNKKIIARADTTVF